MKFFVFLAAIFFSIPARALCIHDLVETIRDTNLMAGSQVIATVPARTKLKVVGIGEKSDPWFLTLCERPLCDGFPSAYVRIPDVRYIGRWAPSRGPREFCQY